MKFSPSYKRFLRPKQAFLNVGKSDVGSGIWEVVLVKCKVGLGKSEVGLGKSEVGSRTWEVGSGTWEV